jgi:hypothetical protein
VKLTPHAKRMLALLSRYDAFGISRSNKDANELSTKGLARWSSADGGFNRSLLTITTAGRAALAGEKPDA